MLVPKIAGWTFIYITLWNYDGNDSILIWIKQIKSGHLSACSELEYGC